MRFPFILRSDHEEIVRQLSVIINCKDNEIVGLKAEMEQMSREIGSLVTQLTDPPQPKGKTIVEFTHIPTRSRSGWRTQVRAMSNATQPAPKDSIKQLEEKVKSEGGKV